MSVVFGLVSPHNFVECRVLLLVSSMEWLNRLPGDSMMIMMMMMMIVQRSTHINALMHYGILFVSDSAEKSCASLRWSSLGEFNSSRWTFPNDERNENGMFFDLLFSFQWQIVTKDHRQRYLPHRLCHRRIAMLLNVLMLPIQIVVRHLDKRTNWFSSLFFSFPTMSLLFNMDFHWRLCVRVAAFFPSLSLFLFFFWSIHTNVFNTLDVDLNSDPIVIGLRTAEEMSLPCVNDPSVQMDRQTIQIGAERKRVAKRVSWREGRMIVDWEICIS